MTNIILCGGSGTRLWPLSRTLMSKQFVKFLEDEFLVRANESTYIPMGELHRLENVGKIPLVMIEAQVGKDDIIRIDDDFKRIVSK